MEDLRFLLEPLPSPLHLPTLRPGAEGSPVPLLAGDSYLRLVLGGMAEPKTVSITTQNPEREEEVFHKAMKQWKETLVGFLHLPPGGGLHLSLRVEDI